MRKIPVSSVLGLAAVSGAVAWLWTCMVHAEPVAGDSVTFCRDVAPIMFNKCSSCHHDGEVAPFPLMSYEDAHKRATLIRDVVVARYMPPWKPTLGYGEFQGCRALTEEEISSIKKWVEQGAPEGDEKDMPPVPKYSSEWRLGTPDLVLQMPEPFKVPASGPDVYRCFVLPLGLDEHKFVTAVEFKPSNRKVVHHCLFYLDAFGAARKKDAADDGPGFASFGGPGFVPTGGLGGWAPGNAPGHLQNGVVRVIRAKSDLVLQTHFHPSGKQEWEQSTVGIYFSKKPPKKLLVPFIVRGRKIEIPADDNALKYHIEAKLPIDLDFVNVTPHAHLICRSIKAEATKPDGEKVPLISIGNWNFNWQDQYTFKAPIKLPAGTVVTGDFVYDNSAANPSNPNHPPKRVTWGEQTTDEMAILFFGTTAANQDDLPKYFRAMLMQNVDVVFGKNPLQWTQAVRRMAHPTPVPLKDFKKHAAAADTQSEATTDEAEKTAKTD